MNLGLAKWKKRRHHDGRNPFSRYGTAPSPAYLRTSHDDGLAHAMRLERIRNGSWHTNREYERQLELTSGKKRYQLHQTHEMEYQKLKSATNHGLLEAHAQGRMEDLKNLLGL